jgi:hypothetical protein
MVTERETHGFERVLADIRFVTQVKPDAEELFRIALRWTPEERASCERPSRHVSLGLLADALDRVPVSPCASAALLAAPATLRRSYASAAAKLVVLVPLCHAVAVEGLLSFAVNDARVTASPAALG